MTSASELHTALHHIRCKAHATHDMSPCASTTAGSRQQRCKVRHSSDIAHMKRQPSSGVLLALSRACAFWMTCRQKRWARWARTTNSALCKGHCYPWRASHKRARLWASTPAGRRASQGALQAQRPPQQLLATASALLPPQCAIPGPAGRAARRRTGLCHGRIARRGRLNQHSIDSRLLPVACGKCILATSRATSACDVGTWQYSSSTSTTAHRHPLTRPPVEVETQTDLRRPRA